MKKLALISTFCNTAEKQKLLENTLDHLHKLGVDTLIFSPKNFLPPNLLEKPTHCILTEENYIPPLEERMMMVWKKPASKLKVRHDVLNRDYGWASINQFKRLLHYGSGLGYDILYPMIYDVDITPEIEEIINNNTINYFFPNVRPGEREIIFPISYIFGTFTPKIAKTISERFTYAEYLLYSSAEKYYKKIQEDLNLPIHDYVVKDLHFELGSGEFLNVSPDKSLSLFIDTSRVYKGVDEVCFHFYEIYSPSEVTINGVKFLINEEKLLFVRLDPEKVNITVNGKPVKITNLTSPPVRAIKITSDKDNWDQLKNTDISTVLY